MWRMLVRAGLVVPALLLGRVPVSLPAAAADSGPSGPSPSNDPAVQSAQSQAARLEAEIQAQGYRINALAEQYDLDQINASRIQQRIAAVQVQIKAAEAQVTRSRLLVRQGAVAAYEDQGSDATAVAILQGGTGSSSVRAGLAEAAVSNERQVISRYERAEATLQVRQSSLQGDEHRSVALAAQIQATSQAASNEVATERATLASVNSQVAQVIAADQQRATKARQQAAQAAEARQTAQAPPVTTPPTTSKTAPPSVTAAPSTSSPATTSTAEPPPTAPSTTTTAPPPPPAPTTTTVPPPPPTTTPPSPPTTTTTAPPPPPPTVAAAPTTVSSVPPPNPNASIAVETALAQVGKPYQYGGAGPYSFDCSGLVMYAWAAAGVDFPHYAPSQYDETTRISASQLEPGDLVFYYFPGEVDPGHVGMYIGGGDIVVADTTGTPVRVESMYFDGTPMGYGRVS
jgi:peptidoglycan DL-endopeptidase CwlO